MKYWQKTDRSKYKIDPYGVKVSGFFTVNCSGTIFPDGLKKLKKNAYLRNIKLT